MPSYPDTMNTIRSKAAAIVAIHTLLVSFAHAVEYTYNSAEISQAGVESVRRAHFIQQPWND